jgi:hypothetical protein
MAEDEVERHKEEKQRARDSLRQIKEALGFEKGRTANVAIGEVLARIGSLHDEARQVGHLQALLNQPSLEVACREKPEELPAKYAFQVAMYVNEQVDRMMERAEGE